MEENNFSSVVIVGKMNFYFSDGFLAYSKKTEIIFGGHVFEIVKLNFLPVIVNF